MDGERAAREKGLQPKIAKTLPISGHYRDADFVGIKRDCWRRCVFAQIVEQRAEYWMGRGRVL